MLLQVVGPGSAGGAFVGMLPRSAAYAAPLHPKTITAAETADKRDAPMPLVSAIPHPRSPIGIRPPTKSHVKTARAVYW